jgi:hypothetical protein
MLFTPKEGAQAQPPFRVKPRKSRNKKVKMGRSKMNILVRGVDPAAVKKADELAKRQGISRNIFLVNLINNYAALEEFKSFEQRYRTALDRCLNVIQRNSKILNDFMEADNG